MCVIFIQHILRIEWKTVVIVDEIRRQLRQFSV